jgi:hypothetical protein
MPRTEGGRNSMQYETPLEFNRDELVQFEGQWRLVQRKTTTCGRLFKTKQIPARLMSALDKLVESAARALGVAIYETDDATAKGISRAYDGMPSHNSYGPRSPSVRQIEGAPDVKYVADRMPPEMRDVFWQCFNEELGAQTERPFTLTQLGEQRGYQSKKQASASGGTMVYDMLANVAQFRRDYLSLDRKKRNAEAKEQVHPESPKSGRKRSSYLR